MPHCFLLLLFYVVVSYLINFFKVLLYLGCKWFDSGSLCSQQLAKFLWIAISKFLLVFISFHYDGKTPVVLTHYIFFTSSILTFVKLPVPYLSSRGVFQPLIITINMTLVLVSLQYLRVSTC